MNLRHRSYSVWDTDPSAKSYDLMTNDRISVGKIAP